jgi:hypothetical protein
MAKAPTNEENDIPRLAEAVNRAAELFDKGQLIIDDAIAEASQGNQPAWEAIGQLDLVTFELRNQARLFQAHVEGLDANSWKPWQFSERESLSAANELREICELQTQHKILNESDIQRWAEESRLWFRELVLKFGGPTRADISKHYFGPLAEAHGTGSGSKQPRFEELKPMFEELGIEHTIGNLDSITKQFPRSN